MVHLLRLYGLVLPTVAALGPVKTAWISNANVQGPVPAPTPKPQLPRHSVHERDNINYAPIAGYLSGDGNSVLVCPPTDAFYFDLQHRAAGCCNTASESPAACHIPTSCIASTDIAASCGSSCDANPQVTACTDPAYPKCVTNFLADIVVRNVFCYRNDYPDVLTIARVPTTNVGALNTATLLHLASIPGASAAASTDVVSSGAAVSSDSSSAKSTSISSSAPASSHTSTTPPPSTTIATSAAPSSSLPSAIASSSASSPATVASAAALQSNATQLFIANAVNAAQPGTPVAQSTVLGLSVGLPLLLAAIVALVFVLRRRKGVTSSHDTRSLRSSMRIWNLDRARRSTPELRQSWGWNKSGDDRIFLWSDEDQRWQSFRSGVYRQ